VVDREHKIAFLEQLDVLSTPTVYSDPKGIFVLEAMAAGVPFVQPDHGTFREMTERTGGGILVQPDHPQDLAAGLLRVIRDPQLRSRLAHNAYQGVRAHYTVEQMASQTLAAFMRQQTGAAAVS
jgi:glycosyltransferase involved in cell wall biosynthesis